MNPIVKMFLGANVLVYRATGGKVGGSMFGGKVLLLTTKGSKSGKDRTVPLMYFEGDYGTRIVVASAGGSPVHPAWFKNLKQHSAVVVQAEGRKYPARADIAVGQERARLWSKIVAQQPRFDEYAKKAQGREIPIVVLNEIDPDTRPC
jgi:deazaflavin-dependent oxidoreductase (nitroreductase family)